MKSRATLLRELVCLDRPVNQVANELTAFGWDSDVELVRLEKQHFKSVLMRFLQADVAVSAGVVRAWAETIEGRDDIGFEDDAEGLLKKILFDLANPEITRPLTPSVAKEFLHQLGV